MMRDCDAGLRGLTCRTGRGRTCVLNVWRGSPPIRALLFVILSCLSLSAQNRDGRNAGRLPSAERIIGDYVKAAGGRARLSGLKDAAYDWMIQLGGQTVGTARTLFKAPASTRTTLVFGNGEVNSAANASSAWESGLDGSAHTLTDTEAGEAKLQAALRAGRLLDYQKLNVAAHTISLDDTAGRPAYVVEFSVRTGARVRYWFDRSSKLLVRIEDTVRKTSSVLSDYRADAGSGGVLEPHRVEMDLGGTGRLTFLLQQAHYNQGLTDKLFDAPRAAEALDIPSLLREVARNQAQIDERRGEYTFTQKNIEREIDGHGELKKETVKVYEVFPLPYRAPVLKLMSENNLPLPPERAAREDRRVLDELQKAERERAQDKEKHDRKLAERARKRGAESPDERDEPGISEFLRVDDFVSPRREQLRGRDCIVFDFRPRAGFHASNRGEDIISRLVGVVWIDPTDKQIMRLEARLAEGYKIAGGLLLSLRPGAALVFEQTRMAEGVWLPRHTQINLSFKALLFGGGNINLTQEFSDYRRFNSEVGGYKLGSPATGRSETTPDRARAPKRKP